MGQADNHIAIPNVPSPTVHETVLASKVDVLERQVKSLRRQMGQLIEWQDTVSSPLYKRIWWFLCGYKFGSVGRWYGN